MTATDWSRRMTDVEHTHPHDDPCLGDAFCRGDRRVVADGGRRGAGPEDESIEETADEPVMDPEAHEPTMRDVSHTPPTGEGANDVFQRGDRGRDHEQPVQDADEDAPTGTTVGDDGDDTV